METENCHDDFQDEILTGYISLLLKYCQRFYHRQFITRKLANTDILSKFDSYLKSYFADNIHLDKGLPTVNICAEHLCLSPNYFSDLIRKMTGESANRQISEAAHRAVSFLAPMRTIIIGKRSKTDSKFYGKRSKVKLKTIGKRSKMSPKIYGKRSYIK